MVNIKDIEKKMNMLKVVHNFHDCDILNLIILVNHIAREKIYLLILKVVIHTLKQKWIEII